MAWVRCCGGSAKPKFPLDLLSYTWNPTQPDTNVTVAGQSASSYYTMVGKTPVINDNVLMGTICRRNNNGEYTDIEVSTDGNTWTALSLPHGNSRTYPISVSLSAYNGSELFIRAIARNANPNTQTFIPIVSLTIV